MSQPIAWRDIKAWSDVTQTPLATHEIRLLTTLDDFFLSEERKAKKAEADRQMHKNKSKARSR